MYTNSAGIRRDKDGMLRGIISCKRDATTADGRLFPGGTVWLGVMAFVDKEDEHSFTLSTTIVLPEKVVEERPRAETMLRSGVTYLGTWADDGTKLSFAPAR